MPSSLPPLNALRAFESAARHLSFTLAGRELHVSQGAISHQIKALEEHLGYSLFIRMTRKLRLTEEGKHLALAVTESFTLITDALSSLADGRGAGILTVSLSTSFAHRWLLPRLRRFTEANPSVDLRLSADDRLVDFNTSDVDLAIRYGPGPYPGLISRKLFVDDVFPVAAPGLLPGPYPIGSPDILRGVTLLEDNAMENYPGRPTWGTWFERVGWSPPEGLRKHRFSHATLILQAATRGQGVALGRSSLVEEDLRSGLLVRPFKGSFPSAFAYHLVRPRHVSKLPKVQAFESWLLSEVEEMRGGRAEAEGEG